MAFEVVEDEGVAVILRQGAQARWSWSMASSSMRPASPWVLSGLNAPAWSRGGVGCGAAAPASCDVVGGAVKPAGEAGSGVKFGGLGGEGNEDVLGGVFGVVAREAEAGADAEDHRAVGLNELGEGVLVPCCG